ncbi:MAG: glutaredoxin family protein [Proteobacteria bacterium]|nr:glutaredoxin family protein [Pseudomonadota bacterium]MDE3208960.1 glutaredoxin family protein [Pseudomonadota bacterium]
MCEEIISFLSQMAVTHIFTMEIQNVDQHEALLEEYGLLVPVVMDKDDELFRYGSDPLKLNAWLANCKNNSV